MDDTPCVWRWDGIAWYNIVDACESPAVCRPPEGDGNYAGQIMELGCQVE